MRAVPFRTIAELCSALKEGATDHDGPVRAIRNAASDPTFGALNTVAPESAPRAGQSSGPLAGVGMVVKDNIHVAGLPNTAGTRALRNFVPTADAPIVATLRARGAHVIGKAAMHELSLGVSGINHGFGTVRNATDPSLMAGGSSSGVGTAVALGAMIGLGTDTGGSVRIPAALNGVVGFRPTSGRYPTTGITPLSTSRDTPGLLAHSVGDVAMVDRLLVPDASSNAKRPRRRFRIGVLANLGVLDPRTQAAFDQALESLRRGHVELVETSNPLRITAEHDLGLTIVGVEAHRALNVYLEQYLRTVNLQSLATAISNRLVRATFEEAILPAPGRRKVDAYRAARIEVARLRAAEISLFSAAGLDAIAYPTTPAPAAPINDAEEVPLGGQRVAAFSAYTRFTAYSSLIGAPSISVPIPAGDGPPVGICLDGIPGADDELLALAEEVETLVPRPHAPER